MQHLLLHQTLLLIGSSLGLTSGSAPAQVPYTHPNANAGLLVRDLRSAICMPNNNNVYARARKFKALIAERRIIHDERSSILAQSCAASGTGEEGRGDRMGTTNRYRAKTIKYDEDDEEANKDEDKEERE